MLESKDYQRPRCVPPGTLAPSADHEHRRIPLRLGAAPHGRLPPRQARGGRHGHQLDAETSWRKLTAPELRPLVASGVMLKDGWMTKSGRVKSDVNHQSEWTAS